MSLSKEQIIQQSQSALRQWEKQWRAHAERSKQWEMKSFDDFKGSGIGKTMLLVANGYSFEKDIETIKKFKGKIDVFCCDKALGHLLDAGIKPTFCLVADANVNYSLYMEKWKDQLQDTILIQNVCANPLWAENGNWKDRYFFCVKDAIQSEKIFATISGCPNVVAAGTNVSNALVIVMTQCDHENKRNFFGYDRYCLIGFDYCWLPNGNYYAFDHEGRGKRYYMRHNHGRTIGGDYCYSSNNLTFSMQWLQQYINAFHLPVVNCSKDSVLTIGAQKRAFTLEEQLTAPNFERANELTEEIEFYNDLMLKKRKMEDKIRRLQREQRAVYANNI